MLLYNSYTAYIQCFKLFAQLFERLVFVLVEDEQGLQSFKQLTIATLIHFLSHYYSRKKPHSDYSLLLLSANLGSCLLGCYRACGNAIVSRHAGTTKFCRIYLVFSKMQYFNRLIRLSLRNIFYKIESRFS